MAKPPTSIAAAHLLIVLNALVWLAIGIILAARGRPFIPGPFPLNQVMAILSLLTSGILLALFLFLRKRNRIAYFASLAFLAALAILTITDQVGLADLVVLIITVAAIACLVFGRAWYLQGQVGPPNRNRAT